jgi:hypothetical protein
VLRRRRFRLDPKGDGSSAGWLLLNIATVDGLLRLQRGEKFGGTAVFEGVAGPVVDLVFDGPQMVRCVDVQAGALGKYWRSNPFAFSLLPRCHGERESQK